MSNIDRCIFISIAIGIWALAMTQIFKPEILNASWIHGETNVDTTNIRTVCPKDFNFRNWIKGEIYKSGQTSCRFQIVVTWEEFLKYKDQFRDGTWDPPL